MKEFTVTPSPQLLETNMNKLITSLRIVKGAVARSFAAWMRSQASVELFLPQVDTATSQRWGNDPRRFY